MQRSARKRIITRSAEQGQVTVMIAILMVTLLFMLAFTVNVGMLVHAKINLQNAADLAAYAGASTQARQLNTISYLNYEMRRQYKKFLFRNYILGNMAQPTFPRSPSGTATYQFRPREGATPYNAPIVCITFQAQDNPCQVQVLRPISIPEANPLDQISQVLTTQLRAIENARRASCTNIGTLNESLVVYWLYNTDPDLNEVATRLEGVSGNARSVLTTLRGLGRGVGLVPKLFMLNQRIRNLGDYVNLPAVSGMQYNAVSTLMGQADAPKHERIIQAYLSAYHTLGEHLFDADSIEMTELMQTPQLRLQEQRVEFEVYPVSLKQNPSGPEGNCTQFPVPYAVRNLPVGVYKDPRFLTYYALRLTAKARLLFNPFGGELEMTAYSAAQPFGSRIGPKTDADMFSVALNSPVEGCNLSSTLRGADRNVARCVNRVPAVNLLEAGGPVAWQSANTLGTLYQALTSGGPAASASDPINLDSVRRAMRTAMAPTPWELGKYNIPGGADRFVEYFSASDQMTLWAPLYEGNNQSAIEDLGQEFLQQLRETQPENMSAADKTAMAEAFAAGFRQYITRLQSGAGESEFPGAPGENVKFYRMANPFTGVTGGDLFVTDTNRTKSSWNDVHNEEFKATGRAGYSVKFVAMRNLASPGGVTSDGSTTWENRPIEDASSEGIYERLEH